VLLSRAVLVTVATCAAPLVAVANDINDDAAGILVGQAPLALPVSVAGHDEAVCPAPQPAFVSMATTPWTVVLIDGVRVGTTPLFRLPVAPGPHVVDFINEAAGVVGREEVVLQEAELRKLKLIFVTAQERTELDESRAAAAVHHDECVTTDGDRALLSVDVKPWARVFVDGRLVGSTPLFRYPIRPGTHHVRLEGPGGENTALRFDAAAAETVKLALRFASPAFSEPPLLHQTTETPSLVSGAAIPDGPIVVDER
jgi:hypothetical protein